MTPQHPTQQAPQASQARQVVIIGAGYAGLFAARRAARHRDVAVTLIDPTTAWTERTRLHQVATGDPSVKRILLEDLFAGTPVQALAGTVVDLDLASHKLTVHTTEGLTIRVAFDQLVYALGSTTDTATVPGTAEHAHTLDSTVTAEHLHGVLAAAPRGRVAVVGGGLTGIETATEVATTYPDRPVSLITASEIGHATSPRGRRHLSRAMDRLGIERHEHTRITRVDESGLTTAQGEHLPANIVVWAAGIAVPDLAARSELATDHRGRILVDQTLRSTSHPDVFAAGDSAHPVQPVGAPVRPSAYVATIMGAHAGTNLVRVLAGKPPKPLRFGYLMQSVSLGRTDGLVQFTDGHDRPLRWVATGRVAAAIKEFVEQVMVVGLLKLERRVPGAFAWRPAPRTPLARPTTQPNAEPRTRDAADRAPR